MGEYFRIFKLLMLKNALVRRKHWKIWLFVEIAIPLGLFFLGAIVKKYSGSDPEDIDHNSIPPSENINDFPLPGANDLEIRYTPFNPKTKELMEEFGKCLDIPQDIIVESLSEELMVAEFSKLQSDKPGIQCLGIVFQTIKNSTLPKDFRYNLRTTSHLPEELYDMQENGRGAIGAFAFNTIIIRTQTCLDRSFITLATNTSNFPDLTIQQMPYPPYIALGPSETAGNIYKQLAHLAFLVILCTEVTFPTNEKYIGVNILMSVNGVKNHQNLFSWFICGLLVSVTYLGPITVMFKYFSPPYLLYGNAFIVWLVLTIHACHVIAFGMHITAYLWKPSHGVFASFMVVIVMDIINNYTTGKAIKRFLVYMGILSPNYLLSRIMGEINSYEARLIGIQWNNIFSIGDTNAPPECCIAVLVLFSLIGIIIHFFATVYIYAVRPGKYGVAQNPFFFLQKGNKVFHDVDVPGLDYEDENLREFEKVPGGALIPGIQIRQLKKSYVTDWFRGTKVQALRGIDVDFYRGQITALLGHNGAGKTTMMSILTGLISSTEGMVFVNGKNVQYELNEVRRDLGLCPQENMVFPDLTVEEQVLFFGMLKAKDKTKKQLAEEAEILLSKVNLTDKKNSLAKELSGGQKRRMCLAMAVIGDAKVLILDEPTSGMDAESKREVWDIILKLRGEKTILISTHDMEEADILGDRVAIIHSGKMRSYGTSMFLKKLYGNGQVEVTLSVTPDCDCQRVIDTIGLEAQILNKDEGQVVLAIPLAENLPEALDNLESKKKLLGITGLSVSIITLEQVFLRVTRECGDETDSLEQPAKPFIKITGFRYFVQTTLAFIVKKLTFTRKNPWSSFITTILPLLAAILMILNNTGMSQNHKPISLGLDAYSHSQSLVYAQDAIYAEKYEKSARVYGGTAKNIGQDTNMIDALLDVANEDLGKYRNKFIVSGEFNSSSKGLTLVNGFFSGTAYLGIPATINMLTNAIAKVHGKSDEYSIRIFAENLPRSIESISNQNTGESFLFTLSLLVFLAPAVAQYVIQPLQENLASVKHLQSMTGASSLSYWASIYILDLIQYVISIILLICSFVLIDYFFGTQYYRGTEIAILFLILFLFGASVLPLVYIFSFGKKTINTCTIILSIGPIILSFIDFLLWGLENTVDSKIYQFFRDCQSKVFLLIPHMSLIYGHVSFYEVVLKNARCRRMPPKLLDAICSQQSYDQCCLLECHNGSCNKPLSYFVENPLFTSLGQSLVWMTCSIFLFFGIIVVLEMKIIPKFIAKLLSKNLKPTMNSQDDLVKKEAELVASEILKISTKQNAQLPIETENIYHVHELNKTYGYLHVVRGISFRVKQFECFGLLGVNGAGKSTTFRMLTGEEFPNSGSMYLREYSLAMQKSKYLSEMGYCPQHDAILDTLNAWDHLYLFGRLRGIPGNEIKTAVEKWIYKLNLQKCASQPSGTYSGGNKRRLNIAMALIGNPSLVLMDEPTTGVDPAARRALWNTLKTCQEGGQSIILTSHSMEECEVLCNRLVIMVKGQLVCVGASQELKHRFGAGYNIHVKLSPNSEKSDLEKIKERIESSLLCKLVDENTGFIGYHVTDSRATWTRMYSLMNELKNSYPCIEDFAVLSSTLEQLFIQFARAPRGNDENDNLSRPKRRWFKKSTPASRV